MLVYRYEKTMDEPIRPRLLGMAEFRTISFLRSCWRENLYEQMDSSVERLKQEASMWERVYRILFAG